MYKLDLAADTDDDSNQGSGESSDDEDEDSVSVVHTVIKQTYAETSSWIHFSFCQDSVVPLRIACIFPVILTLSPILISNHSEWSCVLCLRRNMEFVGGRSHTAPRFVVVHALVPAPSHENQTQATPFEKT